MKKLKQTLSAVGRRLLCLVSLCMTSCVKEEKIVEVEVLGVSKHDHGWVTLLEDEEGRRKGVEGKIGSVGDVFKIRRVEFHRLYSGSSLKYED